MALRPQTCTSLPLPPLAGLLLLGAVHVAASAASAAHAAAPPAAGRGSAGVARLSGGWSACPGSTSPAAASTAGFSDPACFGARVPGTVLTSMLANGSFFPQVGPRATVARTDPRAPRPDPSSTVRVIEQSRAALRSACTFGRHSAYTHVHAYACWSRAPGRRARV